MNRPLKHVHRLDVSTPAHPMLQARARNRRPTTTEPCVAHNRNNIREGGATALIASFGAYVSATLISAPQQPCLAFTRLAAPITILGPTAPDPKYTPATLLAVNSPHAVTAPSSVLSTDACAYARPFARCVLQTLPRAYRVSDSACVQRISVQACVDVCERV
jgi:hypothetical protein